METVPEAQVTEWALLFRAFKDVRWDIIKALLVGSKTAEVIAGEVGLERRSVNNHLRAMEGQGLLQVTKNYPYLYRLTPDIGPFMVGVFRSVFQGTVTPSPLEQQRTKRHENLQARLASILDAPQPLVAEAEHRISQLFDDIEWQLSSPLDWLENMSFVPRLIVVVALARAGSMSAEELGVLTYTGKRSVLSLLNPLLSAGVVRRHGFVYYVGNYRQMMERFLRDLLGLQEDVVHVLLVGIGS